ncbi:hypothetical protein NEOLEDRAFT_1183727 [Neolentinus lepideus HHB14362 ss-1]|uniref:Serine protein kinase n=1 Tax=Neolentinus lepideus HHB14362 ss-1 TaxID=1314782 RepID=A0A165N0M5_9AGAM|nr:hypothetical protein NEOLEDRAFT_1183727 [Neolentinus lepideus HHB14362 ss-1]
MAVTIGAGNKRVILVSEDYILEPTYPERETWIYTNASILPTRNIRTRDLHLHTASFSVLYDSAYFDASGDLGKDLSGPQERPSDANGGNGYNVCFSSANVAAGRVFGVHAQGGDGGAGYSGIAAGQKGGDGGNGGDGGIIFFIYNDIYRVAFEACRTYHYETDDKKKQKELQEWIDFCQQTITHPQWLVDNIRRFADTYANMSLDDQSDGVDDLLESIDSASSGFASKISSKTSYHGGFYGVGGQGTPTDGKNGASGQMGQYKAMRTMRVVDVRACSEMLFHPDQVAMTLRDALDNYFLGSDESVLHCGRSLRILIDRLSFLSDLKSSDPLYRAYAQYETDLFILPSGGADPTSVTSLKNSLQRAKAYMSQLGKGFDFYGHDPTWVPRGSYDFYKTQLKDVLDGVTGIEDNYWDYVNSVKDQIKRRATIRQSQVTAKIVIDRAKSDIRRLEDSLSITAKLIASFSPLIPEKRKALLSEIEKLSYDIQHHFAVSFSNFIDAAAQFAFSPGLPMGTVQAGRLIFDAKTTIPDGYGGKIDKDYLINQVEGITADTEGLEEGLKMGSGSPTLTIDDPGAAKLIAEEKKLVALINQYGYLLKDLKSIRAKFDDYIKMVLDRNNAVIHYNAMVTLWAETETTINQQEQKLDVLNHSALDDIDPSLPVLAAFVRESYFHTVAQALRLLYVTERALAFWTLQPPVSNLATLRANGFERKGLSQALQSARTDILVAYDDVVENSTNKSQKFSNIRLDLDADDLSVLKDGSSVILRIPEAYSFTLRDDSPFADCSDVRLTTVRFYVKGATTNDSMLSVSLAHLGAETIVDVDDLPHNFTHNQIQFKFQYNYVSNAIQTDGDIGDLVNGEYALPGPFAYWSVAVNDSYNKSLDLSDVTCAWFEFSGWSRPFG